MGKILYKEKLAPQVYLLRVEAPAIAKRLKAGQFVIVHKEEISERIPLTIADSDQTEGSITLIIQAVGKSTIELCAMEPGDVIQDIMGPLGRPTPIEPGTGRVAVVGGGIGIAVAHPVAKAMKAAGHYVIGIIGARTKELLFWEDKLRGVCSELHVTTDDGSYAIHGFVTTVLEKFLKSDPPLEEVTAIGPIPMMKAVAELTRPYGVKTLASLNPIMVDATGMCGGCRVSYGDEVKFVCVDGPDLDAHKVDFNELMQRNKSYRKYEEIALHECKIGLDK
jgi:NAD(P)H-flavin reductase